MALWEIKLSREGGEGVETRTGLGGEGYLYEPGHVVGLSHP